MPSWTPVRHAAGTGALCLAVACACHIGPAVTWLPAVRTRALPRLTGLGDPQHVALTFDDGPDPQSTPLFLDALQGLGARATFFVLGSALARHPDLGSDIARRGHELAVHGWDHTRPWCPTPRQDLRDLVRAASEVGRVSGARPRWYRPPYGILTAGRWRASRRTRLRPVLWSAWGRDWTADATPATVLTEVSATLQGGGTVLLHDSDCTSHPGSWRSALGALPDLVHRCRAAGWSVGPLAEHGIRP
ncbi:hypothetical protein N566_13645 [Streptomycetaceae bacterium MP113-05]|nr:hypothetical protein N566_13645 [Streptomycetaceae bacterium MP113-05]